MCLKFSDYSSLELLRPLSQSWFCRIWTAQENLFTAHMVGALGAYEPLRALFHSASSSSRIYTLARASQHPSHVLSTPRALKSVSAECPCGHNISDPCQLSTPSLEALLNGGLQDSTLCLFVALVFYPLWAELEHRRLLSAVLQFCVLHYVSSSEKRPGTERQTLRRALQENVANTIVTLSTAWSYATQCVETVARAARHKITWE